jgi:hypothetical protein
MRYRLLAAVVLLLCTTGCMNLKQSGVYVMRWEPVGGHPNLSTATLSILQQRNWLKRCMSGENWVMRVDGPPGRTLYDLKGRIRWGRFNGICELQTRRGPAVMELSGRVKSATSAEGEFDLRIGDEQATGLWKITPSWEAGPP